VGLTVNAEGLMRPLNAVMVEGVQLSESAPTIGIALEESPSGDLI